MRCVLSTFSLIMLCIVVMVICFVQIRRLPAVMDSEIVGPLCGKCGYSLRGHDLHDVRCPECGNGLRPQDIFVGKDIWLNYVRKRLRWWTLAMVLILFASPLWMPGRQRRWAYCEFIFDVSPQMGGAILSVNDSQTRWSFPLGRGIPGTQRDGVVEFKCRSRNPYPLEVAPDRGSYLYRLSRRDFRAVDKPLAMKGLVEWLEATQGIVWSEDLKLEIEGIWAHYQAVVTHTNYEPPPRLFIGVNRQPMRDWGSIERPGWLVNGAIVTGAIVWLIGALRIRRRGTFEASMAGAVGQSLATHDSV